MNSTAPLSYVKTYAVKTLECFDELAKPEIQNRVMAKLWNYIKSYTLKIIKNKPDAELKVKLFKIHNTLGPLFNDVRMSVEIKEGEALGSPKIPNVGELAKIKELTSTDLLKELKL